MLPTVEEYAEMMKADLSAKSVDAPVRLKDFAVRQQWWVLELALRKRRLWKIKTELAEFVETKKQEEARLGIVSRERMESKIANSPEYKSRASLMEEEEIVIDYLDRSLWNFKEHAASLRTYVSFLKTDPLMSD